MKYILIESFMNSKKNLKELFNDNLLDLKNLENKITNSWSKETSVYKDYNSKIKKGFPKSYGQSEATSLVLNEALNERGYASRIVWMKLNELPHFFNEVIIDSKKTQIDLTRDVLYFFLPNASLPPGIEKKECFENTKEYLLSLPRVRKKYFRLKKAINSEHF